MGSNVMNTKVLRKSLVAGGWRCCVKSGRSNSQSNLDIL